MTHRPYSPKKNHSRRSIWNERHYASLRAEKNGDLVCATCQENTCISMGHGRGGPEHMGQIMGRVLDGTFGNTHRLGKRAA